LIFAFSFPTFAQKVSFLPVNFLSHKFDEIMVFDQFGKLPLNDQKARLDALFTTITNDKTLISFIEFRLNKKESRKKKIKRFKAISRHFDRRKVDKTRFILAFVEGDEEITSIYVQPQNVSLGYLPSDNYKIVKGEEFEQKIQELFPKK